MSFPLGVQSALISVVTATVVTLIVEYAAKPRLEARKERLLTRYKLRHELEARVLVLHRSPLFSPSAAELEPVDAVRMFEAEVPSAVQEITEVMRVAENLLILGHRDIRGIYVIEGLRAARRRLAELAVELRRDEPVREVLLGRLGAAYEQVALCVLHLRPHGREWAIRWRFRHIKRIRWELVRKEIRF
ncbi:hypothetical protein M8542_33550 [Amycolatopsis sp. OK19-0408]|uniref:Uncharacterized protein n=1 Tax=Amycolatopsis iheyensis TaxID=2945988 RepID=A0A9X2SMF0_9PSEU|nr:hypothetical protein [Amycolatopsis iheyensis]MCR6487762.1 hypothetical protein [Amycolatopsis iheyensis]